MKTQELSKKEINLILSLREADKQKQLQKELELQHNISKQQLRADKFLEENKNRIKLYQEKIKKENNPDIQIQLIPEACSFKYWNPISGTFENLNVKYNEIRLIYKNYIIKCILKTFNEYSYNKTQKEVMNINGNGVSLKQEKINYTSLKGVIKKINEIIEVQEYKVDINKRFENTKNNNIKLLQEKFPNSFIRATEEYRRNSSTNELIKTEYISVLFSNKIVFKYRIYTDAISVSPIIIIPEEIKTEENLLLLSTLNF